MLNANGTRCECPFLVNLTINSNKQIFYSFQDQTLAEILEILDINKSAKVMCNGRILRNDRTLLNNGFTIGHSLVINS